MARFKKFPKIPDSLTPNLTERARRTRPCVFTYLFSYLTIHKQQTFTALALHRSPRRARGARGKNKEKFFFDSKTCLKIGVGKQLQILTF